MSPNVKETKEFIETKLAGFKPETAILAGSGLGGLAAALQKPITIPYADLPHFPKPRVPGHAGQLVAGELAGKRVLLLSGRFHLYEGHGVDDVVYPVHVIDSLGVKLLIVTNAAGGIDPRFRPGDLMMMEDHINLLGVNPLLGGVAGNGGGIKFLDLTQAYSPRLREKLESAAERLKLQLWRGVYLATTGPSYETPAEVKAFAWLGADAVGMSTVPEVILARFHNIEVAGVCVISNLAAGITGKKLSHDDVLAVGQASQEKLTKLLTEFLASV